LNNRNKIIHECMFVLLNLSINSAKITNSISGINCLK
jgi:hypothetical protein